MPTAPVMSIPDTASEPRESNLPLPYGYSFDFGCRALLKVVKVIASLIKSDAE